MGGRDDRPDDRSELERLMRAEGVVPLGAAAPRRAPEAARGRAAPAPAAPAPRDPGEARLEALAAERDALASRLEALAAERDALASRLEGLAAQRSREAADREAALAAQRSQEAAAREAALAAARRAGRAEAEAELGALLDGLPRTEGLGRLLERRGLAPEERARALAALAARHPEALLDLEVSPPGAFTALLDRALALTCGAPACAPGPGVLVLEVEPARCEVCGGSDLRRAFAALVEALSARGRRPFRLLVVGGSPAYHAQLRELARPHREALRLDLLDGGTKPGERRVRDRVRGADLVVIWGATMLDHATSEAVVASGGRRLDVPHRGLSGMLRAVALSSGRA